MLAEDAGLTRGMDRMREEPIDDELRLSFLGILIEDVLAADARRSDSDTQTHRREIIRAVFAAIEGSIWLYREHVRSIAKSMGLLTPVADLALRERSFSVTERGTIIEQVRFVTLPTIIKLTNRQAQLIDPSLSLDVGHQGWSDLKQALEIRHRITHPKNRENLHVTKMDLAMVRSAFSWVNGATETYLTAVTSAFRKHVVEMREVVDGLVNGDKAILAAYRAAVNADEGD
jgi:hypothetical protein